MSTSARRIVSLLMGAALLVASCTSDSSTDGSAADGASGSSEVSFCSSWTEMKSFSESEEPPDEAALNDYLNARRDAAGSVPDGLADEWDTIVAWDDQIVEVLYSVNFDPDDITETIVAGAFGSVEEADEAEARQQLALGSIDRWSLANCAGNGVDALAFCDTWTDIYLNLSGVSSDQNRDPVQRERDLADWIAQASSAVPPEIEDAWNSIADYHLAQYDVLVTVDFEENLISDELLTDAFGSPEAARVAATDAGAAVGLVEEWSKTGCGDLCVRGREGLEALGELTGSLESFRMDPYRFARNLRSVEAAGALVPAELQVVWKLAVAEAADWFTWWESHDFDPEQLNQPEAIEQAVEMYRSADYPWGTWDDEDSQAAIEEKAEVDAWRDGAEPSDHIESTIVEMVQRPPSERPGFQTVFIGVDQWLQNNCDNAGGPGVLEVEFPEITGAAGSHLVIAVGPVGSTFADLENFEQFEVGNCEEINRDPWGIEVRGDEGGFETVPWSRQLSARVEEAGDELCGFHGRPEPLDAGPYTLVAAQYDGLPRSFEAWGHGSLPDPTHCLAIDINISGDTRVQIPDLPLCEVPHPVIDADEWSTGEAVLASAPGAGTLKLRIPDHRVPPKLEFEGGERGIYQAVVLPAGTTLNEVGREEVFPSGAGCILLPQANETPDNLEIRPIEFPIGDLPPAGSPSCLDPLWLNGAQPQPGAPPGAPPDDSQLPLTVLAAGIYDVRVWVFNGGWEHEKLCATFEVTIDGDTVVDVPELGECR